MIQFMAVVVVAEEGQMGRKKYCTCNKKWPCSVHGGYVNPELEKAKKDFLALCLRWFSGDPTIRQTEVYKLRDAYVRELRKEADVVKW